MMGKLRANSVQTWFTNFVTALADTQGAPELVPSPQPALTYRPELPAARLS